MESDGLGFHPAALQLNSSLFELLLGIGNSLVCVSFLIDSIVRITCIFHMYDIFVSVLTVFNSTRLVRFHSLGKSRDFGRVLFSRCNMIRFLPSLFGFCYSLIFVRLF